MTGRIGIGRGVAGLALVVVGCAGHQHLNDYSFGGKKIAVVYGADHAPTLLSGNELNDMNPPFEAVDRSPTRIARSQLARIAQVRFDTALATMNFADDVVSTAASRAAAQLGAHAVSDPTNADFVLHVDVSDATLNVVHAANPYFVLNGSAVLRDAVTGREIWRSAIERTATVADFMRETGNRDRAVSVRAPNAMSAAEYQQLLEQLARFAAYRLTDGLATQAAAAGVRGAAGVAVAP